VGEGGSGGEQTVVESGAVRGGGGGRAREGRFLDEGKVERLGGGGASTR
jgi:hypothetical protein